MYKKKPPKPTIIGKYLDDVRQAYLAHLQDIGLYSKVSRHVSAFSPVITHWGIKLALTDVSQFTKENQALINEKIDVMWEILDILYRLNKSKPEQLNDLRSKLTRLETILLKNLS